MGNGNDKRRARNAEKLKRDMAKQMEDVCLHCAFFQAHGDKWPDWRPDGDNVNVEAFNDLCRSAVKIVAEVFSMLDEGDQMHFMQRVMVAHAARELGTKPVAEVVENIANALRGQTKH
jgi:hypothetical protein